MSRNRRTTIVTLPPKAKASILKPTVSPAIRGEGDISTVLVENAKEGQVKDIYIICPSCGKTSALVESH